METFCYLALVAVLWIVGVYEVLQVFVFQWAGFECVVLVCPQVVYPEGLCPWFFSTGCGERSHCLICSLVKAILRTFALTPKFSSLSLMQRLMSPPR